MVAVPEITVDELARQLADGAALVDVRQPEEYTSGHVPGAVLVPLATVPENLGLMTSADGKPVYLICRSGGRSANACVYLAEQGLDAVNVQGGMIAWVSSGRDVVEGIDPS